MWLFSNVMKRPKAPFAIVSFVWQISVMEPKPNNLKSIVTLKGNKIFPTQPRLLSIKWKHIFQISAQTETYLITSLQPCNIFCSVTTTTTTTTKIPPKPPKPPPQPPQRQQASSSQQFVCVDFQNFLEAFGASTKHPSFSFY